VFRTTSGPSRGRIGRPRITARYLRRWLGPTIAAALVAADGLVFDALTPQVVSVTPFYVVVVLIGFWFPRRKAALALAPLATPLIIIGYWLSIPDRTLGLEAWANRGLSICSVWLTAFFVWHIRVLEQKLQQQNDIANSLSRGHVPPTCASVGICCGTSTSPTAVHSDVNSTLTPT
jgi:hypothetical protein